jgi:hypothetical protein
MYATPQEYLTFALRLALEAERVILSHYLGVASEWEFDGTEGRRRIAKLSESCVR